MKKGKTLDKGMKEEEKKTKSKQKTTFENVERTMGP